MSGSAGKLGVLGAFWIAVGLIQIFNWGSGIPKALAMLALLAAAPLLPAAARRAAPAPPLFARAVESAFWIALALNLVYLGARIIAPHIIDIGTTTLAAGQAVLHGENPYAVPFDMSPESAGFYGYKYLPMMIADYLPLGATLGQRGVLITNLVILLAILWLMKRIAGTKLAPLALVMVPLLAEQIFAKGATDLAAVLPLLAALALAPRRSFWCGLCIGLAIATKPMPGIAMLPALIPPARREHWAAGVLLGLLPIVPFVIAGPQDLWRNVVLFNLSRVPDSTSWLATMPPAAATAASLVFAATLLAAAVYVWRRDPPLTARAALAAMLGIAAILAGPGAHHNYQLWWLPFYALLLGLTLAPPGRVGYITAADFAAKDA